MPKVKPAGPIALRLRTWMNENGGLTIEEVNRALVILSNQSLHHLLGNGNGRGEARSSILDRPAKPTVSTVGKGVNIDDEHCQS
jgi:hypothetical protein